VPGNWVCAVRRAGWQYAAAGLMIALIAAVVSYNDGLFVARLAGNHDHQAYLYPFLPDGLFVIGLLALVEGARMRPPQRSAWAMAAVLLGITLSTAMNVGAGIAHSLLDAFLDGMVPVVLLIAVEVVLWHVRRGRRTAQDVAGGIPTIGLAGPPATPSRSVSPDVLAAAEASMAATVAAGNPWSRNRLQERFRLPRSEADEIWRKHQIPEREAAPIMNSPAGTVAAQEPAVPAGGSPPAGASRPQSPAPAGASPNGRAGG